MNRSEHRITFIHPNGRETLLLDWDELVEDWPQFPTSQTVNVFTSMLALNGEPEAVGGGVINGSFSRVMAHESNAAAFTYQAYADGLLPLRVTGSLRVEIYNGATMLYEKVAIQSSSTKIQPRSVPCTLTIYSFQAQRGRPLSFPAITYGLPAGWLTMQIGDIDILTSDL